MSIYEKILASVQPDDRKYWTWQHKLATRLIEVMGEQKLNQKQLAEKTGLTEAQVTALIQSNANPTLRVLARISQRLGTDLIEMNFVVRKTQDL
ncbi:MAG: helix-turn-helix transcriptional regulator [Ignavibacteria bacterium]|nr:helix-turn-helix transcriptional regulator [Ignavibacteria bacterium]